MRLTILFFHHSCLLPAAQVHQPVARHGSMLDLGGAGSIGSGVHAPTARSRLASTGFGSMTDLPSARFGGDWPLGSTGLSGNGFGGASADAGVPQFDRLSAWRRDADLGGAGPSSGVLASLADSACAGFAVLKNLRAWRDGRQHSYVLCEVADPFVPHSSTFLSYKCT